MEMVKLNEELKNSLVIHFSDENFKVIEPLNDLAMSYLAQGTQWNTKLKENDYLLVLINSKNEKFLLTNKWGVLSTQNGGFISHLPDYFPIEKLVSNTRVIHSLLKVFEEIYPRIEKSINLDVALDLNPKILLYVDNPTREQVIKCIEKEPSLIRIIDNASEKLKKLAISNSKGEAILIIENPSDSLWELALNENPFLILRCTTPKDKFFEIALKKMPYLIKLFKNYPSEEFISKNISCYPQLLKGATNQTEEMCLEAVRKDGYCLKYVINQTSQICKEAIKTYPWAFENFKPEFRTPDLICEMLSLDPKTHCLLTDEEREITKNYIRVNFKVGKKLKKLRKIKGLK